MGNEWGGAEEEFPGEGAGLQEAGVVLSRGRTMTHDDDG